MRLGMRCYGTLLSPACQRSCNMSFNNTFPILSCQCHIWSLHDHDLLYKERKELRYHLVLYRDLTCDELNAEEWLQSEKLDKKTQVQYM